uniref:Uncharacterized protein n=1 Tax=uncultured bacterium fosmid pJB16B1 TaxID=1478054 RepID=A0A0H3U9G3_9BACT|nr:hypothetical protein [uncultured bacterium fosmid pJB16B1]
MTTKFRTRNPVTRAQYPKFFTLLRKAALNLGLDTPQEVEEYRHQVMREEAGCESIKQLNRKADFDACIKRFAADAGDYIQAVEIGLQETKRRAYVVKVMSVQIMQLKGGSESDARNYLEGLINQARVPCGVCSTDNSFWMDVSTRSLQNLLQILDTYRRKLLKANFPTFPVKFDDTVRYEVDGPIRTRYTGIPISYYSQLPFRVNVR